MREYTSVPDAEQKDVAGWLENLLIPGKMEVKDVKAYALAEGFSWYSVGKAASSLKVAKRFHKPAGQHGGGTCFWSLPEQAVAEAKKSETPPVSPTPAVKQTVENNRYLAVKEGYMQ